jgi:hypothetical protein
VCNAKVIWTDCWRNAAIHGIGLLRALAALMMRRHICEKRSNELETIFAGLTGIANDGYEKAVLLVLGNTRQTMRSSSLHSRRSPTCLQRWTELGMRWRRSSTRPTGA